MGCAGFSSIETASPTGVQLDHAVGGRVGHPVAEDHATVDVVEPLQLGAEALAVEDVVAEHQAAGLAAEEVRADGERLGESLRFGLHRVA